MRTALTLFDPAFLIQVATPVVGITPAFFNPVRWYDADTFSLADDAIISPAFPWNDQSPNGKDAVSDTGQEPTFHTNSINGKPIVRFAGAQHMVFEELFLGEFTILCVLRSGADSNYVGRVGINRQIRINRIDQPRASWFSGASGTELISNQLLSNAALPRMIGHRRNFTPSGAFKFFDGLTDVDPIDSANWTSVTFGINEIGDLGDFTPTPSIDIAELVIYDTSLTTDEIRTLYNDYFKPKFALP